MTLAQLRKLIADDAHAGRFLTREAYRMSLLVASVGDEAHSDATTQARERKQQELIAAELKRTRSEKWPVALVGLGRPSLRSMLGSGHGPSSRTG